MEANNLVVSVLSARGISLKGHTRLDALVTLTLHGRSSLRSRVSTDIVGTDTADVQWNENCEFKLIDGANKLSATVQHKTRLGTLDLIGKVEIGLSDVYEITSPTWFPLVKKSKEEKYRGELLLKFAFSYVRPNLSISNVSLNRIPKENLLHKLKGKIRRKGASDSQSVAAFPMGNADVANKTFTLGSTRSSNGSLPRDTYRDRRSLDVFPRGLDVPATLSPVSTAGSFTPSSPFRPPSVASSGFGSRVNEHQLDTAEPVQEWDLAAEVDRLRAELAVKDSRLHDMEEYVDRLVQRIMDTHPDLLSLDSQLVSQRPTKSKRLFY